MNFRKYLKLNNVKEQINAIAFMTVLLLILMFFMFLFPLTTASKIDIFLPRAMPSDIINQEHLIVTITEENLIYLNEKVVPIKELHKELSKYQDKDRSVLIKVCARASLGRIIEVWDIFRSLGIEKINLATTQENS